MAKLKKYPAEIKTRVSRLMKLSFKKLVDELHDESSLAREAIKEYLVRRGAYPAPDAGGLELQERASSSSAASEAGASISGKPEKAAPHVLQAALREKQAAPPIGIKFRRASKHPPKKSPLPSV